MSNFLIIVQLVLALFLIIVVMLQKSDGASFGMGDSKNFMSARGSRDFLTTTTSIIAALFMIVSFAITFILGNKNNSEIIERLKTSAPKELSEGNNVESANGSSKSTNSESNPLNPSVNNSSSDESKNSSPNGEDSKSNDSEKKSLNPSVNDLNSDKSQNSSSTKEKPVNSSEIDNQK